MHAANVLAADGVLAELEHPLEHHRHDDERAVRALHRAFELDTEAIRREPAFTASARPEGGR